MRGNQSAGPGRVHLAGEHAGVLVADRRVLVQVVADLEGVEVGPLEGVVRPAVLDGRQPAVVVQDVAPLAEEGVESPGGGQVQLRLRLRLG